MKESNLLLKDKNIIITRSKEQISEVKSIFEERGAKVLDLPALIIQFPDDLGPLDDILKDISHFNWLIFSSSNGIKFFENRLKQKGLSLQSCVKNIKIAVVGEKTSQFLKELNINADFIPPQFIADSLINNFPEPIKGLKILLPRVQSGGRNIISQSFVNEGAFVTEVATYESRCPESIPLETLVAIKEKKIDAVLFSSGKTVQNSAFLLEKYFCEEWQIILNDVKFITIGPQTTIACKKYFGRVDKEANIYTFQGMLDAAIEIFNSED